MLKEKSGLGLDNTTINKFHAALHGQLIRPGDAGYDDARQVWNGMI